MTADRAIRGAMLVVVVVEVLLAVAFVAQVAPITRLMPFPGRTPLSDTLIGSFAFAAAASTGWCLFTRSDRAMAGVALDYIAVFAPVAVVALIRAAGGAGSETMLFGLGCGVIAVAGIGLLRWSLSHPWRGSRAAPRPVRWSFGAFVVLLLMAGGALTIGMPRALPWTITPELSTLFGLMFLGAAAYFAYGLLDPRWENAGGQLAGFLAYDLVLIVPFITRLGTVDDQLRLNLVLYLAVVIGSGLLAGYYLLLRPGTRVWPRPTDPNDSPSDARAERVEVSLD